MTPDPLPPARAAPALRCRQVTKRFGELVALDNVTLEIPPGSIVGLLGPNGAGKTTLIRILLGLTPPSEGSAEVLGTPVPPTSVLPRIGYMPQNLGVYTDLTVEQNLRLFGRLLGLSRSRVEERAAAVLALVALGDRRRSLVSQLSGGMQRRVSLACALLADPDLLLLDEPTVGVDPELRAEFWEYFRALAKRGRTVVMTTHYMGEAAECFQVAMMHQGTLVAVDTPARILARTGAPNMDDAFLRLVRERTPRPEVR